MKNVVTFLTLILLSGISVFSQVGINTDNSTPDPSAMLDLKSANKGFLPPRIGLTSNNTASPVTAPSVGLLVYNTATAGTPPNNVIPGYYFWNGTYWTPLAVPQGESGQTLRNDGNNWVANSLLYNDGTNIGIGTITSHKFTVAGTMETVRLIGPGTWGETAKLNFGDGDYVSISEDIDDKLLIHAAGRTAITGGNVGIGTTTPSQMLTVAGMIQTTSGGIKYPDNTIQTTAAVANNIHTIGESYGGGIVFYVYDNEQHGLIASTADQSTGVLWYNGSNIYCNRIRNDGISIGRINTDSIIGKQGLGTYAAQICAQYLGGGFGDWYLPSKYELNLLYQQKAVVGGFGNTTYWSSSEQDAGHTWSQFFFNGNLAYGLKTSIFYVRAIRAF